MQGFLFQYGTALHLALLTVAPLFIFAIRSPLVQAGVLFGLSLFAAVWVVMNPSPRVGEWPRDARHRIGFEIARDPFSIVCILLLVISAVRALNGGVCLDYDASAGLWLIRGPHVGILPGSVSGRGAPSLAGMLGLTVTVLGVRHALGVRARQAYLFASAILAAAAVGSWWMFADRGFPIADWAYRPDHPSCPASLLGGFFVFAVAAWVGVWRRESIALELLAGIAASVLLVGLLRFAPLHSLCVFGGTGVVLFSVGVVLSGFDRKPTAWFGTAVALGVLLAPAGVLLTERIAAHAFGTFFPEGFVAVRDAASGVAIRAWKASARLGAGLGAYPLSLGFFATPDDWRVLTDAQSAAPNGWLHFLFERGILGICAFAGALGVLVRDGVLRFIRAGSDWRFSEMHLLGPLLLAAVSTILFVDCSYAQVETLIPVGAALAATAASFPDPKEEDHG